MRRIRNAEDDASFKGLAEAVIMLRKKRGMDREELAEKIEEEPPILAKVEQGEVSVDLATMRVLAHALGLRLGSLIDLAEEHAPGEGGDRWRRRSQEAEREQDQGSECP